MPRASAVLAFVAAAALLATIGSPANADVYSNESTADSYLIGLSTGGAATLSGEVFTAPGGTLDSWTFSVANGTDSPPGNVQFVYIAGIDLLQSGVVRAVRPAEILLPRRARLLSEQRAAAGHRR